MTRASFTGKQWSDPPIAASPDPHATAAALAATRDLGADAHPWTDASTYPMAAKAAERLRAAALGEETVGIIGDYDCDGLTSTAILARLLQRLAIEPVVRLPHRLTEGYGAQLHHVEELHGKGVTLLLTVDTGIVATDALLLAREKGIDVIVIDHHAFADLPPAFAVLHPALTALRSTPAAAGVALAFAHAVLGSSWPDRDTDLALAAIGTIADVVPLTHENRALVREGLAALGRVDAAGGLGALRDRSGIGKKPTSGDVAFRLAPRLNAAGRLDDATIGLRALLGDVASVDILETLNAERQRLTQACMDEAMAMVDASNLRGCVCVASASFPRGIVGLIAGKLTERFGRPSAAIAIENGLCTASLRGVPAYDIAAGLRAHAHLFTTFGGHAQAGGCSFHETNLPAVMDALHAHVCSTVDLAALRPVLALDASLPKEYATLRLADALASLEPFGADNREPLFLVENVELSGLRRVGADKRHLQARVGQLGAIGFGLGHLCDTIREPVDLACRVTSNEWNGMRRAQLSIVDIRAAARSAHTGASLPSISNTAITGTFSAEAIL